MDFFFLVLTTLTFFLRPDEMFSELQGVQVYYGVIVCTLLLAFPRIVQIFTTKTSQRPVLVFVLMILFAIPVSHVVNGAAWRVIDETVMFAKVLAYFIAILAIVFNKTRWYRFVGTILGGSAVLSTLAVVDYFGIYDFPFIKAISQVDVAHGEVITSIRLQACGVFNDPNDLAMLAVVCICLCGGWMRTSQGMARKLPPLILAAFFFWILLLTQSRGALLGLMSALLAFTTSVYGLKRSIPILVVAGLGMGILGGRQGDISSAVSSGTGQHRTDLWFGTIQCFKTSPLVGIGSNTLPDEIGQVAHNSFIHIFGELGVIGAFAFVGCFIAGITGLWSVARQDKETHDDPSFQLWAAPLLAMLIGTAGCQYSISRNYVIPTYLFLGIVCTYLRINYEAHGVGEPALSNKLSYRIVTAATCVFVATWLVIRFT